MMRAFACAVLALSAMPGAAEAAPRIETLSTRPDKVTRRRRARAGARGRRVRVNGRVDSAAGATRLRDRARARAATG